MDERYADLVIGKRNWQIAAAGLLLATIILAAGMVLLSSRTRYIVYAVEVDKLAFRADGAETPGWYCYLRVPLRAPRRI